MSAGTLCQLPPPASGGCCDSTPPVPATPVAIYNPPGLTAISYRIGTFSSFRRAMLDRIPDPRLLQWTAAQKSPPPPAPSNPFVGWRESDTGQDYQATFVELWAYLADVLTFYQERLANEAYIGTATQLDSAMRLADLIDYRPNPGAGASGSVAFTVAKGKVVSIPAGFRVGSRAQPGKPATVFETSSALIARAQHSAIPMAAVQTINQFAPLSALQAVAGQTGGVNAQEAVQVLGKVGSTFLRTLQQSGFAAAARADMASGASTSQRTIHLQGINNRLAVNDYVLTIENEGFSNAHPSCHQLISVVLDPPNNQTKISWSEPSSTTYDTSNGPVNLYAFGITAGAFGNTAPLWKMLSPTLTGGLHVLGAGSMHAGAPSVTMSWTLGADKPWSIGAVPLLPASGTAISVDHKTVTESPGQVSSLTWPHEVGSGSNLILIVGISFRDGNVAATAVTYGNVALTSVGSQNSSTDQNRIEMWYLLAPPSGAANVVVSMNASKAAVATAISFVGVDQTDPLGAFASAGSDGSTSASVTVNSGSGELVVDTVAANGGAKSLTAGASQTEQWNGHSGHTDVPYPNDWDSPNCPAFYLPRDSSRTGLVELDAVYKDLAGDSSWIALMSSDPAVAPDIHRFASTQPVSLTDYALNSKVTRVMLNPGDSIASNTFGIRETMILTGARLLPLQNQLPLADVLQGNVLILAGVYPDLQDGQTVIIAGTSGDPSVSATVSEVCTLLGEPVTDNNNGLTTVTLRKPLVNIYSRASTTLYANVVAVTQGQTVKDEVLGNGNGQPFQTFELKKSPLTFLPSPEPEGLSAVQSTLTVTVNGVRWTEQAAVLDSGATAQDYTATIDSTSNCTVGFGDGINGARPPTGQNNVHARYRTGLGTSGNVAGAGVSQLIDSLPGLQQVTNPQPTLGGADPDDIGQTRINAPASLRTFNRAVSVDDYGALALTYPGIAKARASWVTTDANSRGLAQPYIALTVATPDRTPVSGSTLATQLRRFLDNRRDPNVPMRIVDFNPIYVTVEMTVDLLDAYPRQATLARVQAALNPGLNADGTAGYFAFERLDFGENLYLSAVYAEVQGIPGVQDVNITAFRRAGLDFVIGEAVVPIIFVDPTSIAVIANDPTNLRTGQLTINLGSGGFVDS